MVVKHAIVDVDPVPFLAVRFLIGALVLTPFARRRPSTPGAWKAGATCGAALLAGYVLQTVGLQYTSQAVSAFITYLLVVFVPFLAAVLLRQRPGASAVVGVAVCLVGLALLTGGAGAVGKGELLTVGCAVAFALHVLALSELAPRHDPIRLNAVQLAVVGVACLLPGALLGGYRFTLAAFAAAAFTGVFASAVALGLQVWAQTHLGAVRTSLLLMIEPVAAAVLGVLTGEPLTIAGLAGATLILAGIAASEVGIVEVLRRRPSPVERRAAPPSE